MKPIRKVVSMAVVAALGVATYNVGTSLVKDVQFSRAEEQVADARTGLQNALDSSAIYKQVNRAMEASVVQIQVVKTIHNANAGGMQIPPEMFKFFGPDNDGDGQPDQLPPQLRRRGQPQEPDDLKEQATGSGAIMDVADGYGYIVTNNHVVSEATEVRVLLNDGRTIKDASVVATDPKSDVAVVKIKADRLIAAKWGDSDTLEKGDIIVAFGSPLGYVGSMSHGIVSALHRQPNVIESNGGFAYENFIQVDAAINPGNSGGPLVNLHGEVVGINTAIASRTGTFSGIGFAIPSNQAKAVYGSLKASGKVVRGYLGVAIADVSADNPRVKAGVESVEFKGDTGVFVSEIRADGPAINVLQPGDVITEIDAKPIKSMNDLRTRIAATPPDTSVKLTVWRDKKFQQVDVKLGTQPETAEMAMGGSGPQQQPQKMGGLGVTVSTPTADELNQLNLPPESKGALITNVQANSLAAKLGLKPGELITRIGASSIRSADDARTALGKVDLAKGFRIDVLSREGQRMVILPPGATGR